MVGIKETLEALAGVEALAQDAKQVLADGKITFGDLGVLFALMNQFGVLNAAIQGSGLIGAEIKDLDSAEAEQLMAKVNEIVALFKS
jgi:hypothetical protein